VSACRMMSGNALTDGDFRVMLVEACRSKSACVGVGWGKEWGQRSLDHPSE
jgi:hypothetical protein